MIEKLENVTAIAKANVYFDSKVVSHIYGRRRPQDNRNFFPSSTNSGPATQRYGDHRRCLPGTPSGTTEYIEIKSGENSNLPSSSKFGFRCYVPVQYVCSTYLSAKRQKSDFFCCNKDEDTEEIPYLIFCYVSSAPCFCPIPSASCRNTILL